MLAEDIVAFYRRERDRLRRKLFEPSERAAIESHGEVVALAHRVAKHLHPLTVIRLVLQALAIQESRLAPTLGTASLVATLPNRLPPLGADPTPAVVREMLLGAREEIVLLGYEVSEPEIIDLLALRAREGLRVTLIVDHDPKRLGALVQKWPSDAPVQIHVGSEDQLTGKYASIHGKTLLVDQADLLVTSANFTHHGQEENVELGARIRGPGAQQARAVIEHLVKTGIVRPASM